MSSQKRIGFPKKFRILSKNICVVFAKVLHSLTKPLLCSQKYCIPSRNKHRHVFISYYFHHKPYASKCKAAEGEHNTFIIICSSTHKPQFEKRYSIDRPVHFFHFLHRQRKNRRSVIRLSTSAAVGLGGGFLHLIGVTERPSRSHPGQSMSPLQHGYK